METSNKKVILIAMLMAVLTSFLVYVYIKQMTHKPEVKIEYITAYVAAKTLPAKSLIAARDLKAIKVTREYLHPLAVLDQSKIIGKRLNEKVLAGEQILKDRLVDEEKAALTYQIPKGRRAVSVNINEQIQVANLLKPGDYVDVIVSFDKEEVKVGDINRTFPKVSKMIIQNVQLLALSQFQVIPEEPQKELPKTATLSLTPVEAEKLVFASDFGVIRLALRGIEDNGMVDTEGIIRNDLIPMRGVTETKN